MSLCDKMDIFIVTYNRAKNLEETLEQLYSEESPVKDFYITVLDNHSDDETENICRQYSEKYPKFKAVRNPKNIGAILNIIKAMELADKEWYWILGDDDHYDWSNWEEIKSALESGEYDAVNTCWHDGAHYNKPEYLLNEAGFIATSIVNTKHLTSTVMQNACYATLSVDSHCAPIAKILNENGKIYVPNKKLVLENMKKDFSTVKMRDQQLHPYIRDYNIVFSKLLVYQLLTDKKLRHKSNEIICLGQSFKFSMNFMLDLGLDLKRLIEVFLMLNFKQGLCLFCILLKRSFYKKTATHRIYRFLGLQLKVRRG